MKKILGLVFLLVSLNSLAQYVPFNQRQRVVATMTDSSLHAARYNGIPTGVRGTGAVYQAGALAADTANHYLYLWSNGVWNKIAKYSDITGGTANANVGSGFRILKPTSQELKTLFNGYAVLIDSSSNTNGLTLKVDTSLIASQFDLTQITGNIVEDLEETLAEGSALTNSYTISSTANLGIAATGTMTMYSGTGSAKTGLVNSANNSMSFGSYLDPIGSHQLASIDFANNSGAGNNYMILLAKRLSNTYQNITVADNGVTFQGLTGGVAGATIYMVGLPSGTDDDSVVVVGSDGRLKLRDGAGIGGSGSSALSSITAGVSANTINSGNNDQIWQWNSLAGKTAFTISSNSTAATGDAQVLFELALSGTNANSGESTITTIIKNEHAGTGAINSALVLSASGGATNYALYVDAGISYFDGDVQMNLSTGNIRDSMVTWNPSTNQLAYKQTAIIDFTNAAHEDELWYDSTGTYEYGQGVIKTREAQGSGAGCIDTTLTFEIGDAYTPEVGDSILRHTKFPDHVLLVWREGDFQHVNSLHGVTFNDNELIFHPPLALGEKIFIQIKDPACSVDIALEEPETDPPVDMDFDTFDGAVTESPANQWNFPTGGNYAGNTLTALTGDGYFQAEIPAGDAMVIGLDDNSTPSVYYVGSPSGTAAWSFEFFVSSGIIYVVEEGDDLTTPTSLGAVGSNTHFRMRRTSTVVIFQVSTDGTNFSDLHTFGASSTGDLFVKANRAGSATTVINPKTSGFE